MHVILRTVSAYLHISTVFRELILPLAKLLGLPLRNVMANRMNWVMDDETGLPSKLAGFDPNQAVSHNKGKPAAIRELRRWGILFRVVDARTPSCGKCDRCADMCAVGAGSTLIRVW